MAERKNLSSSKKSTSSGGAKRQPASRSTSSSKRKVASPSRTSAKASRSRRPSASKKTAPKVYIPASKILLFCACIVLFCTILLIIAQTLGSKKELSKVQSDARSEWVQVSPDKATSDKGKKEQNSKNKPEKSSKGKDKKAEKPQDKSKDTSKESKQAASYQQSKNQSQSQNKVPGQSQSQSHGQSSVQNNGQKNAAGQTQQPSLQVKEEKIAMASSVSSSILPDSGLQPSEMNSSSDYSFIPQAENSPCLVFLFDDGGHNMNQLEAFVTLPFPVTIAVLPKLSHSAQAGERVRKSGNELILHQPMQAVDLKVNPGAGAIGPDMSEDDIRAILFENILEVGPVTGFNNHEGSLITADAEKMSWIMKFASDEGLYFLDSRTNSQTKVPYVAQALGYSYYQRNIFLDNSKDRTAILAEIEKGLKFANRAGSVVMIGHVWSADILPGILTEIYPELKRKGYRFATVSQMSPNGVK